MKLRFDDNVFAMLNKFQSPFKPNYETVLIEFTYWSRVQNNQFKYLKSE